MCSHRSADMLLPSFLLDDMRDARHVMPYSEVWRCMNAVLEFSN
jgi:hypothetical protein